MKRPRATVIAGVRPNLYGRFDMNSLSFLTPEQRESLERRFWAKVDKSHENGCWNWIASTYGTGYGTIQVYRTDGKPVNCGSHRVSFMLNGDIPEESPWILHTCDNRLCVNPAHLYAGTPKQNMADMFARGRQQDFSKQIRGEDVSNAKLTEKDVREIRELFPETARADLARQYEVTFQAITAIVHWKTWKHVT